jgi:pyruvate dehydrogenase E1 component
VAPWIEAPYVVLGTDGYGRSDTREALRAHFEIDAPSIAAAALSGLARAGAWDPGAAAAEIRELGIDPDGGDPLLA